MIKASCKHLYGLLAVLIALSQAKVAFAFSVVQRSARLSVSAAFSNVENPIPFALKGLNGNPLRLPTALQAGQDPSQTWINWSKNLEYTPSGDYMFFPTDEGELRSVLQQAQEQGCSVRVSAQRHSQPPLVIHDNRATGPSEAPDIFIVDMSFYASLGPENTDRVAVASDNQFWVNAGVREDEFNYEMTKNNLALQTATAGGIFSIGGMSSNDVHGATIGCGIFAETCVEFEVMKWDGEIVHISTETELPIPGYFMPIDAARVNLGTLGVVTAIKVQCLPRPWKECLVGGNEDIPFDDRTSFIEGLGRLVQNDRLEVFLDPYKSKLLALFWNFNCPTQGSENDPEPPSMTTPEHAENAQYGAEYEFLEDAAESAASRAQDEDSPLSAELLVNTASRVIRQSQDDANSDNTDLWLTEAARTMFMSYFVELPNLSDEGLGLIYDLVNPVSTMVNENGNFHVAAPLEFRFVKAGSSLMSATQKDYPTDTWFINLDLIGFLAPTETSSTEYPTKLLDFFATVEQIWFQHGLPHQGKMYGFFDPSDPSADHQPFNPNFISEMNSRRSSQIQSFNSYREYMDPNGMFLNEYTRQLLDK